MTTVQETVLTNVMRYAYRQLSGPLATHIVPTDDAVSAFLLGVGVAVAREKGWEGNPDELAALVQRVLEAEQGRTRPHQSAVQDTRVWCSRCGHSWSSADQVQGECPGQPSFVQEALAYLNDPSFEGDADLWRYLEGAQKDTLYARGWSVWYDANLEEGAYRALPTALFHQEEGTR